MRIALGMSGGVDSTICAMLLKAQGHEVIGLTMAKWNPQSGILSTDKRGCYGPSEPQAVQSAIQSAARLGIEHHVINLEQEFEREVLDYYRAAYASGKTPNPCVVCNRKIKFGALLDKARASGIAFDRFATGHYARIRYAADSGRWQLLKAKDPLKDQSYFLSGLSQEQLSFTLFPLGDIKKSQIKTYAENQGFDYLIKKKESQDFLESYDKSPLFGESDARPGYFMDRRGKILGTHKGLIHYTIGQRKGLGLAGFDQPQYVIAMDETTNTVFIGPEEELYSDALYVSEINWLSIPEPQGELNCQGKIRLAHDPVPCTVDKLSSGKHYVKFSESISAITPGQVIAFYDNELVLGSGIIE
ncbi:MAG: tRNA 2-thiouridine(34) synthase MnmA [Candidatus Cloacimonetes bacterium]|nr:tRNA 2-thiouridine(34) synthase MnmA [Candidatus Cloacimonadota bacterium]